MEGGILFCQLTLMLSAKVELSKGNLIHNIQTFKKLIQNSNSDTKFCAILKSNAYGHGLIEIAKICLEAKVDGFGVNSLEEVEVIRNLSPNIPILVMGSIPNLFKRGKQLEDPNLWILISRIDEWKFIAGLSTQPKIHLKIDTGMGRLGTSGIFLENILKEAQQCNLPLDGIATHFASTEDFTEHSYSQMQLTQFHTAILLAKKYGFSNLTRHSAASASALLFDDARMDMVRVGISLYGLWPSVETKLSMTLLNRPEVILKPVLAFKSHIQHIQEIPIGSYIGYGKTYKTNYPTRVGVVPVGYYEGIDRKLSNNGYFLVKGQRANILGRICMNMTMIDITHISKPNVGDEVVIIGESGNECITADDISQWSHTINYETVTRILSHFPRSIVE
jgi:alanine racemase